MEKLKAILNHRVVLILVILGCLFVLGQRADKRYGYSNGKYETYDRAPVTADGTGYYYFLTRLFIYPDYQSFYDTVETHYRAYRFRSMISRDEAGNRMYSKFFTGTAWLQKPFFLVNHAIQKIRGAPADGYSESYQLSISLAGLFYWLLAIIAFVKLLRAFGIRNSYIAIGIVVVTFGTNLCYYTAFEPSISHVYSFFAVNWFLWFGYRWARSGHPKFLMLLALFLGLIFILRPVNVLVVLMLPFLFENGRTCMQRFTGLFRVRWKKLLAATACFAVPLLLHFLLHALVNGRVALNAYDGEGFDFLWSPKVWSVLFSYRKGLFIYAPVLLLFFPGLAFLFFRKKYRAFGILLTLAVLSWIIASWWYWSYGGTLGMRTYIEFFILFMYPVLFLVQEARWPLKIILLAACWIGIRMYSVYEYQYVNGIIHFDEMNRERFWHVFMKKDFRFEWGFYAPHEELPVDRSPKHRDVRFFNPETKQWDDVPHFGQTISYAHTLEMVSIEVPLDSIPPGDRYVLVTGEAKLSNERSILPVDLEYWKKTEFVRRDSRLVGARIPDHDTFAAFRCVFHLRDTSGADRFRLFFRGQYPGDSYRNLRVELFTY